MKPVELPTHRATTCPDDGLSIFLSVRPRLFGIAYRMLGSAADAEDIVQDVWVRWQTTDHSAVRDAVAFLVTITTRLAINVMQSARSRREADVAPWLPEPVDMSADPGLGAERGEALELGILILLEKLSAAERAAYILREAFDYAYRDIADTLRLQEANARQLVTRARRHVTNGRRRAANATEQERLLAAFVVAAKNGDVAGLERRVVSDVVSTCDRGLLSQFTPSRGPETSQHISVFGQWLGEALGEESEEQMSRQIEGSSPPRLPRRCVARHSLLRSAIWNRLDEREFDHETRHHRRHRAHRNKAGDQIEGTRP